MMPIGSPIAGAGKPIPLHKALQQNRRKTVARTPIFFDSSGAQRQYVRGQIGHLNLRQNQKTAVADHLGQMLPAGLIAPADPVVPRRKPPGRRAKGQCAQVAVAGTVDQIAYLGAAQGTGAQVMVGVHQSVPQPRGLAVATADLLQFDTTELLQTAAHRLDLRQRRRPFFFFGGTNTALGRLRQWHKALPVQLQQCRAATHLLGLAVGSCPVKPFTHAQRKRSTRDLGVGFHRRAYFLEHFLREDLTADNHAGNLSRTHPRCPAKNVEHAELEKGGKYGESLLHQRGRTLRRRTLPTYD